MNLSSRNTHKGLYFIFLLTGLILFMLDLALGSVHIPFTEILSIMAGGDSENESWKIILLDSRLPRAIAAILAGIALSIAGLQMQTLFRNPLAGPYLLGISSGAGLGVAVFVMGLGFFGLTVSASSSGIGIVLGAFIGAFAVMLLLLTIIQRIKDIMTVLIIGVMLGSVITALIGVIQFFSADYQLKSFVLWMMGDLNAVSMNQAFILIPLVVIGLIGSFLLSKNLNSLLLGESQARALGTNLKQIRLFVVLITSALAAGITAFCGPIGFIGIIVPHLARMVAKTFDHKVLLIMSALIGINVLLFSDIVSQLPGLDEHLPINSITSLIGIPIILWIILRKKKITQLN